MSKLTITKNHNDALIKLKNHFSQIPFYKKYEKDTLNNNELEVVLEKLPILEKKDLIELDEELYALPSSKISLFSETSGTTGNPLLTPRGQDEIRWNKHNIKHAFLEKLSPETDRVLILHPSVLSPFVEVCTMALIDSGIGYVRSFPIPKICDYCRILKVIKDYKITTIMSTPTLIYKLLFEIKNTIDEKIPDTLNKLLLTGENISNSSILNLQKIIDHAKSDISRFVYGSSETATLMYGSKDNAYRAYLKDFIFELIPIEELNEKNPDSVITGKLLITWLRDGIAPIIRYNTNDIFTVWHDKEINDWLFQPKGRKNQQEIDFLLHESIEDSIYSLKSIIYHFNVSIKKEININLITDNCDNSTKQLITKELKRKLSYLNKNVIVNVNSMTNSFYDFSSTAKTLRFTC